eukprot:CAMPEP_0176220314 /NCGR_PEP_ID=MMETSP0121_2-20121125/19155_1 /TAXON_ID=160619 /ORGANISM="Kryptoperidinium foliaceum, Strain CCMP 1326" /LENGTH=294 /DNA_ID=CAMNT_0017559493 /DNA_START=68 /DNA_END=949 /DNA_ORIENTATION=-
MDALGRVTLSLAGAAGRGGVSAPARSCCGRLHGPRGGDGVGDDLALRHRLRGGLEAEFAVGDLCIHLLPLLQRGVPLLQVDARRAREHGHDVRRQHHRVGEHPPAHAPHHRAEEVGDHQRPWHGPAVLGPQDRRHRDEHRHRTQEAAQRRDQSREEEGTLRRQRRARGRLQEHQRGHPREVGAQAALRLAVAAVPDEGAEVVRAKERAQEVRVDEDQEAAPLRQEVREEAVVAPLPPAEEDGDVGRGVGLARAASAGPVRHLSDRAQLDRDVRGHARRLHDRREGKSGEERREP